MLASFPKVPKTQHRKALKIHVFDYPTVVLLPPKCMTFNDLKNGLNGHFTLNFHYYELILTVLFTYIL